MLVWQGGLATDAFVSLWQEAFSAECPCWPACSFSWRPDQTQAPVKSSQSNSIHNFVSCSSAHDRG